MKAFVSSLLVASALAAPAVPVAPYAPAPYAPAPAYAPAPYHPAPAPYHEEKIPPQPFAYEYGGADEYGRHFAKTETQDEHGVVKGEYRVELPDGRVQIVSYHADHENGFIADVRYEGEAHPEPAYHPPPPPPWLTTLCTTPPWWLTPWLTTPPWSPTLSPTVFTTRRPWWPITVSTLQS